MARDRQRAKQRRRRQGSGPAARAASRTQDARDIGLDDASVDDAGLGDGTPAPDPLEHASADVDQARLAEAGATPPEVGDEDEAGDDLVPAGPHDAAEHADRPERRQRGRVITFLRHCADELRRVQWPNRRQVGQATAVVLGFVVLAGGYLGLLDALWKPIIDAIL